MVCQSRDRSPRMSVWSPRLSVPVSVPRQQRVHPCDTKNHLKNWHSVRHQWPSSVPIILTCAPNKVAHLSLSLSSLMSPSERRRDLRLLSYWFAGCLLFIGADVAAQHAFLECADRAPAFSKVCK